jgi:hypothetical protein
LSSELVAAGACVIELVKTKTRSAMKRNDWGRTIILKILSAVNHGNKGEVGHGAVGLTLALGGIVQRAINSLGCTFRSSLAVRYGKVPLRSLSLQLPPGLPNATRVEATLDGKTLDANIAAEGNRITVSLGCGCVVSAGQTLQIVAG